MRIFRRLQFVMLLSAVCAMSAPCADSAAPHFPTNEDLRHIGNLSGPRISPDGRQVLIRVSDATADGGKSHIWLVDVQSNSFRQLTYTPAGKEKDAKYHGETSAAWMPDGQSILFLSHRSEQTQLFRLPMRGGEAVAFDLKIVPPVDDSRAPGALPPADDETSESHAPSTPSSSANEKSNTKAPEPVAIDVSGFEIAPNGAIALWAKDPETPGEKHQKEEKADALWVDHETHLTRLYLLDPATSKLTAVAVPPNVSSVSWAPGSDRLLAEAEAPNSAGDLGPALSAWLVEVQNNAAQHPVKLPLPATAHDVEWSNDAQHIFFLAQSQADAPPGYDDLYEFNFSGGVIRNLSNGYAGSLGRQRPISDLTGDSVVVATENGVDDGFARFRSGAKPEPFDAGAPFARDLATNVAHNGWVYISSGSTQPLSLMYAETLGKPRVLATPPIAPPNLQSVASKLVRWQSDGQEVDGLLYLPPAAKPGALAPLVVDVHGGPTGAWLEGNDAFTNFLIGQGWAVLRPNPRGSTGRGAAFAAANKNDLGGGDFRDVMAGVDAVLKQFPIDPQRLALIGYSYGGEMAGFVEGKTARFRAVVSMAPVIDQFSEYGTEDESWYDRWFFGKPWEHVADAWRQSPLSGASQASTPFLLLQGQEDTVDPVGQSREMYRALRQMNVPVELVEYPRDNHGPLAGAIFGAPSSEPWQGFDARRRIVEFIQKAFAGKP
jgi:dipeptidyl aminopeptidase/acylaminoacyl peptidase